MNDVLLIDAGSGNLRSVYKALEWCGAKVRVATDRQQIAQAAKVVLPGVGAFGDFMRELRAKGLDEGIRLALERGACLLGICVGMQALFEESEELGEHEGLGLLAGRVVRFPNMKDIKVPHTGWNRIEVVRDSPLFRWLEGGVYGYFNHSYYCLPKNNQDVLAFCEHGMRFACAVQKEKVYGVQFHPEKSQTAELRILKNFVEMVDG